MNIEFAVVGATIVVIVFCFNCDTNIQRFFDFANFFKNIFHLFSKVLKIKEKKKQQLTAVLCKLPDTQPHASQPDTKPQNVTCYLKQMQSLLQFREVNLNNYHYYEVI